MNQKIGQLVAKQRVNEVEKKINKALKSGDKEELIKILKELLAFLNDTQDNVYLSEYKKKAQNWVKDVENAIGSKNTQSKGFFQPKVLIPVALGAVFLVGLTVKVIRSRQRKKITKNNR